MQSVFAIITKSIASEKYFCKEVFCNNFGCDGKKAILGALGRKFSEQLSEFKNPFSERNSILGMAFHDLSSTKTTILGATPGAIPGIDGNPPERFSFAATGKTTPKNNSMVVHKLFRDCLYKLSPLLTPFPLT